MILSHDSDGSCLHDVMNGQSLVLQPMLTQYFSFHRSLSPSIYVSMYLSNWRFPTSHEPPLSHYISLSSHPYLSLILLSLYLSVDITVGLSKEDPLYKQKKSFLDSSGRYSRFIFFSKFLISSCCLIFSFNLLILRLLYMTFTTLLLRRVVLRWTEL